MDDTCSSGLILLFYKYVTIDNPQEIKQWLQQLCEQLSLRGRVILAHEGINATVGGTTDSCHLFIDALKKHPLFDKIDFKQSSGNADHFPRLRITIRKEIVRLGIDPQEVSAHNAGIHLSPEQLHTILTNPPSDVVLFDARNNYESRIGKFANAITPDIENFRDLPDFITQNSQSLKNKTVIMYCTGGIRCERASAYLKQQHIAKEVYQLEGGIHRYIEQFSDGFFKGKNYVFDGRIAMTATDDVLTTCDWCNDPCDEYSNCISTLCNKKIIICSLCIETHYHTCSISCKELVMNKKVKVRTKSARIFTKG